MDDEREVKFERRRSSADPADKAVDLVERSKLVFLREAIEELRAGQARYDVAQEFAKTRQNRTLLVPGIMAGLILLFVAGAVALTVYIQKSINSIRVDIQDFEDVNLREVLDQAKNLEADMQAALREKEGLANELDGQVQGIRAAAQQRIDLLANENLTPEERDRRVEAIRAQEGREVRAAELEYGGKIAAVNTRLEELQARRDQFDARQLEQAREREEVLNNQRLIYERQLAEQKKFYEDRVARLTADFQAQARDLRAFHNNFVAGMSRKHEEAIQALTARYNPTFTDPALRALVEAPVDAAALKQSSLADYRELLGERGIIRPNAYRALRTRLAEYQALIGALKKVPYLNSIPPALGQLEARNLALVRDLEGIWGGLADVVADQAATIAQQASAMEKQDSRIGEFTHALDSLVKLNRENGYILDARDPAGIVVYVDRAREIAPGTLGYVFRRDDQMIAVVRFVEVGDTERVSLVRLAGEEPIQPFDKVLIQVQSE